MRRITILAIIILSTLLAAGCSKDRVIKATTITEYITEECPVAKNIEKPDYYIFDNQKEDPSEVIRSLVVTIQQCNAYAGKLEIALKPYQSTKTLTKR